MQNYLQLETEGVAIIGMQEHCILTGPIQVYPGLDCFLLTPKVS